MNVERLFVTIKGDDMVLEMSDAVTLKNRTELLEKALDMIKQSNAILDRLVSAEPTARSNGFLVALNLLHLKINEMLFNRSQMYPVVLYTGKECIEIACALGAFGTVSADVVNANFEKVKTHLVANVSGCSGIGDFSTLREGNFTINLLITTSGYVGIVRITAGVRGDNNDPDYFVDMNKV